MHVSLDRHRDVVLRKVDGLSDEEVRRPMTPTGTNLIGLVRHLASVEHGWFCDTFDRESDAVPFDENDPEADMRAAPHETPGDILAYYARARAAADRVIEEVDLDELGRAWYGPVERRRSGGSDEWSSG